MNPFRPLTDNLPRERDRWLLWTPLAIGAGIVTYFQLPFEPPLWGLAGAPYLIRDCGAGIIIDDPQLRHHGAHTIYFEKDGSVRTEFVRERRGMRPWSVGWKKDPRVN